MRQILGKYWAHLPRFQLWLLALGLVGLALAQIGQPYPEVAILHHLPTLVFIVLAPLLLKRWPLSNAALLSIFAFLVLHSIGGRYTYTNTPYNEWFELLTGQGLNEALGWQRNNYDRLVHFSFGLLFVLPVTELFSRYAGVTARLALYIAVEFVMGISAIYEVIEWGMSVIMAPDNVEAYNGQQGDYWDAQKDMGLAFLGALVATAIIVLRRRLRHHNG